MADPPVSRLRRSVGLALLLLLLGGAGPVFASHLPAGPARLFEPAPAAVGSASLLALYFLAAWPWLARRRDPAVVLGEGIAALSIGLPFLVGPALVAGVPPAAILSAAAVIAGCALVGAAFLLGPGRRGGGERAFVAFVAGAVAAAPLVNYAANEFLRAPGGLAYRISPPLVIRRILLERPDADPRTFLLGCLACAALLLLPRLLRPGAASLLLLCAAPVARAAPEAENLFGEAWAPGRVLPLRVAAKEAGEVTIPGLGRFRGGAEGGRALLFVPGPATPAAVLPGSPVEGGLPLVLCLAPPSDDLRAAAREGRLALTSARPGWERLPQEAFLSVDAVYDPAGALPEAGSSRIAAAGVPVLRAFDVEALAAARTALRRPWEEPGREFSDQDLRRLFAPAPGPPEDRAVRSLGVLAAFSVAAFAAVRFARGRGRRGLAPVLLVVLGVAAVLALRAALPGLPDATHEVFTAREGTREVSLHRAAARRETMFRAVLPFAPVVLGPGAFEAGRLAGGSFEVLFRLRAGESRLFAVTTFCAPPEPGAAVDVLLTAEGLARPGGEVLPADEFLRREFLRPGGQPDVRGHALRKLVRVADPPAGRFGLRLPGPTGDRPLLEILRVE